MSHEDKYVSARNSRAARFYLWTIRRQNDIARMITLNAWIYVYVLLVLTLFTPVKLETTLMVLSLSGLGLGTCLWLLIERRRTWLLGIRDERLRETAHRVMLDYIREKTGSAGKAR